MFSNCDLKFICCFYVCFLYYNIWFVFITSGVHFRFSLAKPTGNLNKCCSCSLLCEHTHILCLHCKSCFMDHQYNICTTGLLVTRQLPSVLKVNNGAFTSGVGAGLDLAGRIHKSSSSLKGAKKGVGTDMLPR